MEHQDILVERRNGRVEIQINRPDKLNAIRERTADEILAVLAEVELDKSVHGAILTGLPKAFCTGIDTSEFKVEPGEFFDFYRYRRRARSIGRLFRELPTFSKPLIVAVEGYALGGGMELMLLADIVVAGAGAKFGLPECKLGMLPGGGGTQTLPRLVGKALAKELIWTGRRLGADEAKDLRIISHVTADGGALDKARALLDEIGVSAPLAVMLAKSLIDRGADTPLAEGMASESDTSFLLYFSEDRNEGIAAFKEKRPPSFRGA